MQIQSSERFCETCGAGNSSQASICWYCATPFSSSSSSPPVHPGAGPLLAGRYLLCRPIGQGGMGSVYLALDQHDRYRRPVALKQIHKRGLSAQERAHLELSLQHEAELLQRLTHPCIPRLYAYWSEPDYSYLVLDYIDGDTLEQRLQRQRGQPLGLSSVLTWGLQICDTLAYLHQQEPPIIYRDLKPSNIMLRRQDGQLFLIDFGIARRFRPGQSRDTSVLGSPGFAAPEQYGKAQTTPRSDLYSLGVLLHSLLSGLDPSEQPFCFAPLRQLNPAVPEPLEQLIASLVALDPQERPASAEEVRRQLAALLRRPSRNESATPPAGGVVPPPAGQSSAVLPQRGAIKRRHLLRSGLGLAAVAVAIGSLPVASLLWSQLSQTGGSGDLLATLPLENLRALAWSPDGTRIAGGQWLSEEASIAFLWSASLDETLLTYNGHRGGILSMAWSPDSHWVATGSSDHSVHVWDTSNGKLFIPYHGHRDSVQAVAWSPDGYRIASGSADRTVQIWKALSGEPLLTYRLHQEEVLSLSWSPNGNCIASGSLEGTVLVWEAATGQTLWNSSIRLAVPIVAWSPDGTRLAIAGDKGKVVILDAATSAQLLIYDGHKGPVYSLAWAPNSRWLASGGADNLQIWNSQTGRLLQSYPHESEGIRALAWSPDSRNIVMAGTRVVKLWQVNLS
ncbi:protein kinase [Thermogemmatispora sp.]|uniref:protein kinase domain-containing protein n=1 Tax=Thermogemmatispora sp. TaxID=1968838 RepID=UPI0035E41D77